MNYIVFDLEWNQCPYGKDRENEKLPFEIIEIGAVKVDKNLNIIDEYSSLIKPKIYKKLHSKIRTILNYDEDDLSLGRGFKEVCSEFLDWCGKDYIFCTWGPMDLTELQTNMDFYYMDKLPRPLKFLNLQSIYASVTNTSGIPQSMSKLEKAVSEMNIPENEPFHTALNDARYTALVMKEMKAKNINQLYSFDLYITPKNKEEEIEVLELHDKRSSESWKEQTPVVSVGELSYLREKVHDVHVDGKIKAFIVDIVGTTRDNAWLYLGASPRASIALMNSAKAFAAISGRDFVVPEDVLYLAAPVLRHRVQLSAEKELEGVVVDQVIQQLIAKVEIPR